MKYRSPITTHVLDISRGKAADGIPVVLERVSEAEVWLELKRGTTGQDGRIEDLLPPGSQAEPGAYRLTFETGAYFRAQHAECFYPFVTIVFEITRPEEHHHVPLLLSPFGYSTYRGT